MQLVRNSDWKVAIECFESNGPTKIWHDSIWIARFCSQRLIWMRCFSFKPSTPRRIRIVFVGPLEFLGSKNSFLKWISAGTCFAINCREKIMPVKIYTRMNFGRDSRTSELSPDFFPGDNCHLEMKFRQNPARIHYTDGFSPERRFPYVPTDIPWRKARAQSFFRARCVPVELTSSTKQNFRRKRFLECVPTISILFSSTPVAFR